MKRFLQYETEDFTLAKDERVRMVIRRHVLVEIFIFFRWIFLALGLSSFVVSLFFLFGGEILSPNFWLIVYGLAIYLIFASLAIFIQWINTTFDIIFVTNDRVIDISQIDFFHRHVIETRLENIQDATGEVKGFFNTLFGWGKIQIRTANDIADFSIDMVPDPQVRSREIFQLANEARDSEKTKGFLIQNKLKKDALARQNKRKESRKRIAAQEDSEELQDYIHDKIEPLNIIT